MLIFEKRRAAAAAAIALTIALCGTGMGLTAAAARPRTAAAIVIDAGHGGIDAGVCGVNTGIKESDINLAIAKRLRSRFAGAGMDCVMTRTTGAGLYGSTAKGFKMRDMQKRRQIIEDCDASMVISIHQNTCALPSRRGSHVFFDKDSAGGRELALSIQSRMNALYGGECENSALAGDYYMLKCTSEPSVIVECGFLSNAEDEKLLSNPQYIERVADAIFSGVIYYLA